MKNLAIITTHPIQYNAPWFRLLSEKKNIRIKVFYTWSQVAHEKKFDPGFDKVVEWDIPLLDGYDYTFVENISKKPGSKTFKGIQNPTLMKEVSSWKPDAVLVFGWKFKSHLKALQYFHNKIPVIFRGDSTLLDGPKGIKKNFRNVVLKRIYRNIDYALFAGSENKKYFEKSGLTESQLVFVPHAIDNDRFKNARVTKNFRQDMKIPESDIVFLFAGKLEAKKNPDLLASVFASGNFNGTHLVLVGNGPLENDLKDKYAHPQIHFIDFQNQQIMPSVYEMANIFILPSKGPGETWGLAVNEAMACSKPVLVSDKCGCATDLVAAGKTGYVFRSGDADDLRKKIELMISQKNELKEMGNNAFLKIQNWSFDHIVESVEDLVINKC